MVLVNTYFFKNSLLIFKTTLSPSKLQGMCKPWLVFLLENDCCPTWGIYRIMTVLDLECCAIKKELWSFILVIHDAVLFQGTDLERVVTTRKLCKNNRVGSGKALFLQQQGILRYVSITKLCIICAIMHQFSLSNSWTIESCIWNNYNSLILMKQLLVILRKM